MSSYVPDTLNLLDVEWKQDNLSALDNVENQRSGNLMNLETTLQDIDIQNHLKLRTLQEKFNLILMS